MGIKIEEFDKEMKPMKKELLLEDFLKTPSIYSLERAGKTLLKLVKNLREKSNEFDPWLHSLKMDLDIYLADLRGELQHDYDKGNKRYKGKWTIERRKIVGFISRFRTKDFLQAPNRSLSKHLLAIFDQLIMVLGGQKNEVVLFQLYQ